MKKSLSLLVAIAMVFSMFATVAAAATNTQSKYDELKAAGVFVGRDGGDAALDSELTRAEFAGIIARLTGITSDSPASFDDVPSTHWATKDINANVQNGYMQGVGDNKFAPSRNVTLQEVIAVAVRIVGLEVDEDATVDGKAGAWAQPYIAAAIEAGLIQPLNDYTANATRGDLVDVTYEVYQVLQSIAKVAGYEVVSATKVVVSFSDGGEVEVELDEPLQLGKNTITVTYNDREYQVEVDFEATAATAKQIGAKKVEVAFNKAIDDSKVKFAVKNGIITRDVAKVTVSDDKKRAVIELTTRLQNGESVVTISGIEADDIQAKFQAEDERVTQLKFKSDKLALQSLQDFSKVKVGYQVLNQFGEDASTVNTPNFYVSKAGATASVSNGILTITATNPNLFYLDEKIPISGHINMSTYVVTFSETLTVGQPSTLDSIEFKGVYHAENKQLNTASTFSDFYVLIEAKDQYNNKIKASDVNNGVLLTVSNPLIFQVKGTLVDNQGPNKDQVAIQLDAPYALGYDGTNTIRIQTYTGKVFTYDVEVPKAATVSKIALSAPSQAVASNDGSVKIPFVAEDQNGNRITKFSDLDGKIELFQPGLAGSSLVLKQDYATKEAYIEFKLPNTLNNEYAIPVILSARVKSTNDISTIQFNIEKAWVPESIFGLKDIGSDLAVGAEVSIEPKHVVVKDNYGRDKNLDDLFAKYKVVVDAVDGALDTVTATTDKELTAKGDKITLKGTQKGSERIKVQLVKTADSTVVYTYEGFIFNVVDSSSIVEYAVEQLPKISNKAGRQVDLKVTGKRSNGTTVALPADAYSVSTTNAKLVFNNGKLDASTFVDADFGDKDEVKVIVIVTIYANSEQFEQEVVVTKEAPKPTTIELQNAGSLKAENGVIKGPKDQITIANLFATLKIKDQFGFEMKPADRPVDDANAAIGKFDVTIANIDDVTVTAGDEANTKIQPISGNAGTVTLNPNAVGTGDSFTVVFTSTVTGVRVSALESPCP